VLAMRFPANHVAVDGVVGPVTWHGFVARIAELDSRPSSPLVAAGDDRNGRRASPATFGSRWRQTPTTRR
jgi:hypothetical protein